MCLVIRNYLLTNFISFTRIGWLDLFCWMWNPKNSSLDQTSQRGVWSIPSLEKNNHGQCVLLDVIKNLIRWEIHSNRKCSFQKITTIWLYLRRGRRLSDPSEWGSCPGDWVLLSLFFLGVKDPDDGNGVKCAATRDQHRRIADLVSITTHHLL
jgi:hypothetical protein